MTIKGSIFKMFAVLIASMLIAIGIAKTARNDMGDPPEHVKGVAADEITDQEPTIYYPDGG